VVAEDILLSLVGLKIQVTPHEYLEEDEETKIKGLFEDVTDFKGDEIYRPFIHQQEAVCHQAGGESYLHLDPPSHQAHGKVGVFQGRQKSSR
jgi:hypothetical protein